MKLGTLTVWRRLHHMKDPPMEQAALGSDT